MPKEQGPICLYPGGTTQNARPAARVSFSRALARHALSLGLNHGSKNMGSIDTEAVEVECDVISKGGRSRGCYH